MKRTRWILASSLAMASATPAQLWAQTGARTGEVVQATPSAAAVESLNRNLAVLSRSPQDVTALLGAAQAALDLGDIQAANGFFTRANLVNPDIGRAKLGLAIVEIALKQPNEAAANFDAAEALGESAHGHLAERGLAYDLTGQQAKAQRDYEMALRANPADEQARLRYAVSLGISGQVAEANKQIEPALASGDREAWRLRAFIFAMNGRMADARKVTQAVMPKNLADALDPYMERLPLLTPAQKASAAHYGEFPSNVLKLDAPDPVKPGQVQVAAATADERTPSRRERRNRAKSMRNQSSASTSGATTAASAAPPPTGMQSASNSATLPVPATSASVTSGTSGARSSSTSPPPATRMTQRGQPAGQRSTQPTFEAPATVQVATRDVAPSRASSVVQGAADPLSVPAPVRSASTSAKPAAPVPASAPTPGFSASAAPLAAQPAAQPRLSLAEAVSALNVPDQDRKGTVVADLAAVARIQDQRRKAAETAAKAKADKEAKAKAAAEKKAEAERKAKLAANPARIWVQIATGRDVDALAFDLRRLRRTYADALGDNDGWTAEWGATRRLLVGPFKKIGEARATVTQITKSGGDAFVWQSDAGEEVAKIGGK